MEMSVLKKAHRGFVYSYPFPHMIIRDALPEEVYESLSATRPSFDMVCGGDETPNKIIGTEANSLLKNDIPKIWSEFIKYHTGYKFWREFQHIFEDKVLAEYPKLNDRLELNEWSVGLKGRDITWIRCDCSPRVITPENGKVNGFNLIPEERTVLYRAYLSMPYPKDHSTGGNFQILSRNKKKRGRRASFAFDESFFEVWKDIPDQRNTLFIFINSPLAPYGMAPSETEIPKYFISFQGNVVKPLSPQRLK